MPYGYPQRKYEEQKYTIPYIKAWMDKEWQIVTSLTPKTEEAIAVSEAEEEKSNLLTMALNDSAHSRNFARKGPWKMGSSWTEI